LFFYRKDPVTLTRESIFPIEEQSFYRTAAGMKSVAKRPAAGGESCKAGFFVHKNLKNQFPYHPFCGKIHPDSDTGTIRKSEGVGIW
jgi:hypothetical protein